MSMLTKVAKGVAFGDVSNHSIRNILTEISKAIGGNFTEQEMEDTLDYFNWKCPYTGRDLRKSIKDQDGTYATDHIYPQNKEWCGLNIKGNLIFVDKKANQAKHDKDVKTFLLNDTKVLTDIDPNGYTRQDRLDKIEAFQKACGYDPVQIRNTLKPFLQSCYDDIRKKQEDSINDALNQLKSAGCSLITLSFTAKTSAAKTVSTTKKGRSGLPDLIFYPADERRFKAELIKKKKANIVLTYDTGIKKFTSWKADRFTASSDLRGNIESKTFWRDRNKDGLIKVEVFV